MSIPPQEKSRACTRRAAFLTVPQKEKSSRFKSRSCSREIGRLKSSGSRLSSLRFVSFGAFVLGILFNWEMPLRAAEISFAGLGAFLGLLLLPRAHPGEKAHPGE